MLTGRLKAFGLIETLIACGILIMVAGAATGLSVLSVHGSIIAKHKTEAYNIAQGAMEQIKESRNRNWQNWDNFWSENGVFSAIESTLEGNCVFIDHDSGTLVENSCGLNVKGLKFQRKIDKEDLGIDGVSDNNACKKVTVTVEWTDYGQTQSVVVSSYLTNWKPRY